MWKNHSRVLPNYSMDEYMDQYVCQILYTVGFQKVNKRALALLKSFFIQKMFKTLRLTKSLANHSQKANVTTLEIYKYMKLTRINKNVFDILKRMLDYNKQSKKIIQSISKMQFSDENMANHKSSAINPDLACNSNPLVTTVQKYMHIPEFMPDFPPAHTFKYTTIKDVQKEDKALNLKKLLEQRNKAEELLLWLLEKSGGFPDYVNYLNNP